ncbi:MAG: hypothetical protein IPN69_10590 [Acidobacteria bacterium]|nr:hypothetical protein [Acidobacteriota bacterium]MBK8811161.1 hypothetical protein [Acidobacteriota bacterium]
MLPPIPAWDAMHPIIVHFPIALLLIAPLLIVFGLVFYGQNRAFMISAFVLMLLGTIAAVVAVATGSAAGELAERVANVESVLENHEELAETTRNIFLALTVIFGAIVFVPMILKKDFARKITLPVTLAFLVFYAGGAVVLMNAAHEGGRLVHEFGVKAMVASQNAPTEVRTSKKSDDDD